MGRKRKKAPISMQVTKMHPKGAIAEALSPPHQEWLVKGVGLGCEISAIPLRKKKALPLSVKLGPTNIEAPCIHFGSCGGCQFQTMKLADQRKAKQNMVVDLMQPFDGIVNPISGSNKAYNYRNKMEFSFSTRGYLTPQELEMGISDHGSFLGLHPRGWFSKVVNYLTT